MSCRTQAFTSAPSALSRRAWLRLPGLLAVLTTSLLVAPAHATEALIFRGDFEWGGLSRWSSTEPPMPNGVVWSAQTATTNSIDLSNCDLPPGIYRLDVRAENEHSAATKVIDLFISDVECQSGTGTCRQFVLSERPPRGSESGATIRQRFVRPLPSAAKSDRD